MTYAPWLALLVAIGAAFGLVAWGFRTKENMGRNVERVENAKQAAEAQERRARARGRGRLTGRDLLQALRARARRARSVRGDDA